MTKRKNFLAILLLLFLLMPSQIFMVTGYKSIDGLTHIARINEFHTAVSLKQIPVRIAPTLIDGIGYPLFIANYHLPYYMSEIFMLATGDSFLAYKAVMSITYLLSGLFAYLLFREFGTKWAALTGAIVFSYLPYRFGNLYARGAFGESVSLMFVPLILLAILKLSQRKKYGFFLLALSVFGLITTHTFIFLAFAPLFFLYALFIAKPKRKEMFVIGTSVILGFFLSAFQILPSLFEKKYFLLDENVKDLYQGLFLSVFQHFSLPVLGAGKGSYLQAGIAMSVILAVSLMLYLKKKSYYLLFFIAFTFIALFLTHESSLFFWNNLPLLSYILYPYRFLSLAILATSFLAVYLVDNLRFKNVVAILVVILTLYTSRHYYLLAPPTYSQTPAPTLTNLDENETIWANEKTYMPRPIVTASESIIISDLQNEALHVSFEAEIQESSQITVRKLFFPGWRLLVNGIERPIEINNGLISTKLSPGLYSVQVIYKESSLRSTANVITAVSFFLLIVFLYKRPKIIFGNK